MSREIRQSRRHFIQRYVTDPAVATVALLFWGLFKILPVRVASYAGGCLGALAGYFASRRNRVGLINLRIAFPEKTEAERRLILRRMWWHWGRFYAEMPHGKTLYRQADVIGLDYLKQAAASGRGGFVCSAHLGNWEPAVSEPLFDDFYLNPVYRRANNPWLDKLMFQRRKGVLIPKGVSGARKIVEVIHRKGYVVMLCDQKLREGISVPFFGKPAMTAPAIAAMALRLKVPVFMARSIRQPDGRLRIEVSPALEMPPEGMPDAAYRIMCRINQIIEGWIRENPEQWLWIHRRFDKSEYE